MRATFLTLLLLGCPAQHRLEDDPVAECDGTGEPLAVAESDGARLAVRGDAALLAWIEGGEAVVGSPAGSEEVLATGARAIDAAPTAEGFVVAIALEGAIRVVERVGDERRVSELERDARRLSVGAAGDALLVAFDVGDESSALAVSRGEGWEVRPLGRVRGARVASDGTLAAVAATGFDGLALVAVGETLGDPAVFPGDTRTSVAVDVAAGGAWAVGATVDEAGLLHVEAHRWDRVWGEAEAVTALEGYADVAIAATVEPRIFVATTPMRTFVRRDGLWVEDASPSAASAAFPSATSAGSRWGVAWQDPSRDAITLATGTGSLRVLGPGSLPLLSVGERCFHATWTEWTGAGYRSWYWRGE